jgi:hypothetical protein
LPRKVTKTVLAGLRLNAVGDKGRESPHACGVTTVPERRMLAVA